jgi:hypothetical protein
MTTQELLQLILDVIIDNNTNQISPFKLRQVLNSIVNSINNTNASNVGAISPLGYDGFINSFFIKPLYSEWKIEEKAIGNNSYEIEIEDLCSGRISLTEYCLLGRYKNYTNDNNPDNPLNYELLSTSGLVSQ